MKFILDELEQPKAERIFVDRVEPRQIFGRRTAPPRKGWKNPMCSTITVWEALGRPPCTAS